MATSTRIALSKRRRNRVHDVLEYQAVQKLFEQRKAKDLDGEDITSAFDLYSVETLRDSLGLRVGKAVPADVFLWAKGEPARRDVTKIGGMPYWPRSHAWPTVGETGKPYRFLAQINFSDSSDIVPRLPAEILVIFTKSEDFVFDDAPPYRFEWLSAREQPLLDKDGIPKIPSEYLWVHVWGAIHRTADYPRSQRKAHNSNVRRSYVLSSLHGTKIGGVPAWIQGDESPGGSFLFQIASVQAAPRVPYPWVNRKTPLRLGFNRNSINFAGNKFMLGDLGMLYFFLQKSGEFSVVFQCY